MLYLILGKQTCLTECSIAITILQVKIIPVDLEFSEIIQFRSVSSLVVTKLTNNGRFRECYII